MKSRNYIRSENMSVYVGKKGGYSQEELAEGVRCIQDDDLQNRKWRKCHEYPAVFQIVSFLDISEEEVIRLFRNCDKECREAQGWR